MNGRGKEPQWLVVAGTTSPYMIELWNLVGRKQRVTMIHAPRRDTVSFEHEDHGARMSEGTEIIARGGRVLAAALAVARKNSRGRLILVSLGHNRIENLMVAALLKRRCLCAYMGDTNGWELERRTRSDPKEMTKLRLKRAVLSRLFDVSLDLGSSNMRANAAYGIERHVELPLYAVDFDALLSHRTQPPDWAGLKRPILCCVARLVPQKNLHNLMEAWRRVVAVRGEGSLVIVGEGPERGSLEAAAQSIPSSRLRLLGAVDRKEMGGVLTGSNALVLPSTNEPWGIVVTEALGLGKPVLATEHVGAALSLKDAAGEALAIGGTSPEGLATQMGALLDTLEQRTRAAESVAANVRERYGMARVAERICEWAEAEC